MPVQDPKSNLFHGLLLQYPILIPVRPECGMPPHYFAGGPVKKDTSSEDLADRVSQRGGMSCAPQNRKGLLADFIQRVEPGDAVILMEARDPTLSFPAQEIKASEFRNVFSNLRQRTQ